MKFIGFFAVLLGSIAIFQNAAAQVADEIAVDGILVPADIISVDSFYVHYLATDNANLSVNIRNIDFVSINDSVKANLLKRDNSYFAPYIRIKGARTKEEDEQYTSFRDMYLSQKSIMLKSFPYKGADYQYIAASHLKQAGKGLIYSAVLGVIGTGAALFITDSKIQNAALGVGGAGLFFGLVFSGKHLSIASKLQTMAAEVSFK